MQDVNDLRGTDILIYSVDKWERWILAFSNIYLSIHFILFLGKKITVMDPGIAMNLFSGPTTRRTVAMILNHVLYYFLLLRLTSIQCSLGTSGNICKKLLAWHINVFDCFVSLTKLSMYFFFYNTGVAIFNRKAGRVYVERTCEKVGKS